MIRIESGSQVRAVSWLLANLEPLRSVAVRLLQRDTNDSVFY
jgi:hypothetical protein